MHCISLLFSICALVTIQAQNLQQVAPIGVTKDIVPIVASEYINEGIDGKYHYSFETGDGTKVSESGQLKTIDAEHAGESVQGEYSFVGDDGITYSVKYIADENGFQPQGAHLPVAPQIPEAIARSLQFIATAPTTTDQPLQIN